MLIGFTISWSGPIIPKLQDLEQSPLSHKLTDTQASLIASLLYIGCIPGPYLVGWLSNTKGRKPCFLLGGLISIIGYILLVTTHTLTILYVGRLMTGLGNGCIFLMNLVYMGEMSSTNIRGILLAILGISITLGSTLLFTVTSFFSYRATNYVGVALTTIFTLCVLMIPESPMFYVLKGNDNVVKKILADLDRLDDLEKIIASKEDSRTITGSKIDGNIGMLIISGFQLLGSTVAPVFIEKIGRKIVLMISCVICSAAMFVMGTYFYLLHLENPVIKTMHWLPLVILIIFFIGYDSGLGIIPNVLIGEMFTPNVRSHGSTLAVTVTWLSGFLVTTAFGAIVNDVGAFVPFWFFSLTSIIAFFFTVFFIPETKGKSLLQIQVDLDK
ncbi:Solute carrier family 2 facilitated glucose transporter member 8 [Danaus plexippus plexippus]|uniref:Solute carrier family 2 facilitated glucose transporter member 8 n=1 Tax=Danaus plexippus plexippus TaxID=278856 RepID=A0A212EZW1_DANPL|nr:Solute carrier family 2 facilitated glucose transporter member 8 [Danaus plexippus plexippus]